jgi:hypothetical protein
VASENEVHFGSKENKLTSVVKREASHPNKPFEKRICQLHVSLLFIDCLTFLFTISSLESREGLKHNIRECACLSSITGVVVRSAALICNVRVSTKEQREGGAASLLF